MGNILLNARDYEKILQFLHLIRENKGDYRYKVLKYLSGIFSFNHLTFMLVDEKGMFTSPLGLNISNQLCRMYSEYYFKTDIFHPMNISPQLLLTKQALTTTDLMSFKQFENTEYYNDFLKKENLYYEIAMPLKIGRKMIGGVGILRPKEEGNFSAKDLEILTKLSDHIAYHLNEYIETSQLKNGQQIYRDCLCQLPLGLIVLDSNRVVVNCNEKAKTYCHDIFNGKAGADPVRQTVKMVLSDVAFHEMNTSSCLYKSKGRYNFKIVISDIPHVQKGSDTYYLVYIGKASPVDKIALTTLAKEYGLTGRELEIIEHISQGLSNKEIADRLYISYHTVRTHLDNIFNKLGVSSRTAVLYKMGIIDP